ncbi:DUF2950 domain-containing protein [Roseomonas rosulenta]|uniref:DUF2950 domain-containing protein n=1 Tax=Roseomonas rosulenta TaxID=2748667 RepID=UPI001E3C9D6E|nr:DUF2950 domain-containing protein [Roseomonas rosulenta]
MRRTILAAGLAVAACLGPAVAQTPAAPAAPSAEAPPPRPRQPVPPQRFATPEQGFEALAQAARRQDVPGLVRVLGEGALPLIRTGDRASDAAAVARFAAAYDARHAVLRPAPERAIVEVGEDRYPFPVPMVRRGEGWRFDPAQGADEIVTRRIGRNELDTIQTLLAIVDAQDDYARSAGRQGAFMAYARRFFSTPGQRDGLFWATTEDEPPSPLGPFVAAASAGGYAPARPGDAPRPLNGYLFRILEAQGPSAPGGAMDFVVNGRMIGGFGVIAWPLQYGRSGIKTFIVSHRGEVFERDFGPDTARTVARITAYDPGTGWARVPN